MEMNVFWQIKPELSGSWLDLRLFDIILRINLEMVFGVIGKRMMKRTWNFDDDFLSL